MLFLPAASGWDRHRDHDAFGVFAVGPGRDRHREHDTFCVFAIGPAWDQHREHDTFGVADEGRYLGF